MLGLAALVVVLSCVLQVTPDERVAMAGFGKYPLPPLCPSRTMFGVNCPGCGLTRSFVHLAHGDWQASVTTHRVGWLLMVALLLQVPYRIAALRFPDSEVLGTRFPQLFGHFLIALLIGNWLYNVMT